MTGRFVMMTLCFSGCFMALCHKTLFNKCCVQVQYDKIIITLKIKEPVHCVIISKDIKRFLWPVNYFKD